MVLKSMVFLTIKIVLNKKCGMFCPILRLTREIWGQFWVRSEQYGFPLLL